MPLLDRITDTITRLVPSKPAKPPQQSGIGSGHGMRDFEDDMIVSKPTIVFHTSQIFFNFLAMACFASVASFQAKWGVGPSGLTGFAIFVAVSGMLLSTFMLLVPVIYEKYDKFVRLARALKEVRVGFILTGAGTTFALLIAFIVTISAWTQPGCKNADNDPHAEDKGEDFRKGLPGWCNTKKAGAIFFWLAFAFWAASLGLLIHYWRSGKLNAPRDPPFSRPVHDEEEPEEDEDALYTHIPPARQNSAGGAPATRYDSSNVTDNPFADRYNTPPSTAPTAYTPASNLQSIGAGRPSVDAYGAFSDPAPSGFGAGAYTPASTGYTNSYATASPAASGPPMIPEPDLGPRVSRTMQYADPYAAARASVTGQQGPASPTALPPSYESYQGYR
ncbi:hypothetical protein BDQ12DRAFT_648430 [Crucibulum laeve]|uniref:MARVEL domain-containing protein n=1 Tax=Crucibulum laeve TaxID=68775 RepID=A0A5C3M3W6_9AGAR|nr:hypothetical protein BDQ12DRAFT_648430 [Crucibulum laeve]